MKINHLDYLLAVAYYVGSLRRLESLAFPFLSLSVILTLVVVVRSVIRVAPAGYVNAVANHAQSRCIASECMAWREDEYRGGAGEGKGYCGLSGKP